MVQLLYLKALLERYQGKIHLGFADAVEGDRAISLDLGMRQLGAYAGWAGWRDALRALNAGVCELDGVALGSGKEGGDIGEGGGEAGEREPEFNDDGDVITEVGVGNMVQCPHCLEGLVVREA
ncbi:hypothetical protein RSAG8_11748, partial [Rhizoctonia solani AG-8 WAC10335]